MKLPERATSTSTAEQLAAICRAELLGPATVMLRASSSATASISTEQRDELLRRCAAGEYVELVVDFLAFEQKPGERNRNCVRFKPSAVRKLATSGKGMPLLRDHDQWDVLARAGTILESTYEADGDVQRIRMSARATAPWAVEAFLRGNLDRFSIGWRATGPVMCSACGCEVMGDCWHFPGDCVDTKDGEVVCEWIYTAADLVECSAVSVPAVPAAQIEQVRAATLAAREHTSATGPAPAHKESDPMTMIKIATIAAALGLAATLDEDGLVRAASSQTARLTALEAANAEQARRLAAQEVELSAVREQAATRELEEFMAGVIAEGKVAPGGPTDKSLRAYFATDKAGARALAATLPRVTPAGQTRQSATAGATVTAGAGTGAGGGHVDAPTAELAQIDQSIAQYGGTPKGVRNVLAQLGHTNPTASIAKYGAAAFGIPTATAEQG